MKLLRCLYILFCFLILSDDVKASHALGASVSLAKTANQDEYLIRLYFYRDCVGVFVPSTLKVAVSNSNMSTPDTIALSMINVSLTGAANNCTSGVVSNCSGGFGVEEYVYEGLGTLIPAQDWIVSFSECCRNAALQCVSSPNGDYMYAEATLDNLNFPNNSTPEFNSIPSLAECYFVPTVHNNAVTEPDGDSIVYELIQARTNHFDTLPYNAMPGFYCPLNFFRVDTTVALNNFNGDIIFVPDHVPVAVLVVKATEFRNGVECGSVIRDIMLRFINGQVGINENKNALLSIHPVPATDYISIDLPDDIGLTEIKVYNLQGALVETLTASGKVTVDVSKMVQGLYTVQCRSDAGVFTYKFIKQMPK